MTWHSSRSCTFDGLQIDGASMCFDAREKLRTPSSDLDGDNGQGQSNADTQFDSFIGRGVRFCDQKFISVIDIRID